MKRQDLRTQLGIKEQTRGEKGNEAAAQRILQDPGVKRALEILRSLRG